MVNKITNVLIVDGADIRKLLTMIIESEGYQVTSLDNGSAVLTQVASEPPDLILLDVMLGDADGRDICKTLKQSETTRDLPIIIVSATHGEHTKQEKNCGADAYVGKPFDIDDLVTAVQKYVN